MACQSVKNTWFSNTTIYFNVSLRFSTTHFSAKGPVLPRLPKIAYGCVLRSFTMFNAWVRFGGDRPTQS